MTRVARALVIGGGIGGNSMAIELARQGTEVDLVEVDPQWRVYGAGLTMTGPTLRAFDRMGLLDDIKALGFISQGILLFDQAGAAIGKVDVGKGDDGLLPRTGGIMRPVLHRLLCDRVRGAGIDIRLGVTVESARQDGSQAEVHFSDGSIRRYDLVIGADGCFSTTRTRLFPDAAPPRYTGQACWRLIAPKPPEMTHVEFYLGDMKAGLVPCSPTEMYLFLLENEPHKQRKHEADLIPHLKDSLAGFGGRIADVRETIGPQSGILYRPLEVVLQPLPWHCGSTILIGDAVHATTPHLASGAGIAVEDAVVLAEELQAAATIDEAFVAFERRRFERCRLVVDNSVRLGQMEIDGANPGEHAALMGESSRLLASEI